MEIIERLEELAGERELVINQAKSRDIATIQIAIRTIQYQDHQLKKVSEALEAMVNGAVDKPSLRKLLREINR